MRQSKDEHEREVFGKFAKAACLFVAPGSVRSVKPPRPDISCRLDGVTYYFELTRMLHAGTAARIGRHLRELSTTGRAAPLGLDSYDDRAALREAVKRKDRPKHQTGGGPVALLIYIDGVFHPPGMLSEWAQTILNCEGPKTHWAGIWLYDVVRGQIVAKWLREQPG
jgi:hypothetical protein